MNFDFGYNFTCHLLPVRIPEEDWAKKLLCLFFVFIVNKTMKPEFCLLILSCRKKLHKRKSKIEFCTGLGRSRSRNDDGMVAFTTLGVVVAVCCNIFTH